MSLLLFLGFSRYEDGGGWDTDWWCRLGALCVKAHDLLYPERERRLEWSGGTWPLHVKLNEDEDQF